MKTSQLMNKGLSYLGLLWQRVGAILYRFRYLLIWLGIAVVACLISAWATYWYLGIYKPSQELKNRPVVSTDMILDSLQVGLSDFALPNIEVLDLLRQEPFHSLNPHTVWNEALFSRLWIPAKDMGLEQFSAKTDDLMQSLVANLTD